MKTWIKFSCLILAVVTLYVTSALAQSGNLVVSSLTPPSSDPIRIIVRQFDNAPTFKFQFKNTRNEEVASLHTIFQIKGKIKNIQNYRFTMLTDGHYNSGTQGFGENNEVDLEIILVIQPEDSMDLTLLINSTYDVRGDSVSFTLTKVVCKTWPDLYGPVSVDGLPIQSPSYMFVEESDVPPDKHPDIPSVSLFPNPAIDRGTLQNIPDETPVEIYNAQGQKMKFIRQGSSIDCSSWPAGLYFLNVFLNEKIQTFTFLKL